MGFSAPLPSGGGGSHHQPLYPHTQQAVKWLWEGKRQRIVCQLPGWFPVSWMAEVSALLTDHRLLARAEPLFSVYIIQTGLRATAKVQVEAQDIKKTKTWGLFCV